MIQPCLPAIRLWPSVRTPENGIVATSTDSVVQFRTGVLADLHALYVVPQESMNAFKVSFFTQSLAFDQLNELKCNIVADACALELLVRSLRIDHVLEFLVDSINPDGLVIGRNANCDIPVGTRFSNLKLCRVHKTNNEYRIEELGNVASISLTLREVYWYRKSIDLIPRGHAAGIRVDGDGESELAERLRNLPPGDYLTLTSSQSKTRTAIGRIP